MSGAQPSQKDTVHDIHGQDEHVAADRRQGQREDAAAQTAPGELTDTIFVGRGAGLHSDIIEAGFSLYRSSAFAYLEGWPDESCYG